MTTDATDSDENPAAAAEASASDAVDGVLAPWIANPEGYVIEQVAVGELRPGWFYYQRESRGFVRVVAVTVVRTGAGVVHFVDLHDGRTLAAPADQLVFARRPS